MENFFLLVTVLTGKLVYLPKLRRKCRCNLNVPNLKNNLEKANSIWYKRAKCRLNNLCNTSGGQQIAKNPGIQPAVPKHGCENNDQ